MRRYKQKTIKKIIKSVVIGCVLLYIYLYWSQQCGMENSELISDKFNPSESVNKLQNHHITCQSQHPVKRIMFTKTHKTGSSTILNIIARFAVKHDLTIASPIRNMNEMWPAPFRPEGISNYHAMKKLNESVDILIYHSRYDVEYIEKVFPRKETFYITILREPFQQLESAIRYFKAKNPLKKKVKLLLNGGSNVKTQWRDHFAPLFKNSMSFDLGFSPLPYPQNTETFAEYIKSLDDDFDLIMIMEYYVESVVLMRRLLCWSFVDILYVKIKREHHGMAEYKKEISKYNLTAARVNHRKLSALDYQLYEYFNRTLWRKIDKMPEDYHREVKYLREIQSRTEDFCNKQKQTKVMKVTKTEWHDDFILTKPLCKVISIPKDLYWLQISRRSLSEKMEKKFGRKWTLAEDDVKYRKEKVYKTLPLLPQLRWLLRI